MGYPAPDLRFTNDTPYGIMIWTSYTQAASPSRSTPRPTPRGEQTAIAESRSGNCTIVTTTRTITYPDGSTKADKFRATYRPGRGPALLSAHLRCRPPMSWSWAADPPAPPPPSPSPERGRDVMVVDRATVPRDKICGDGLTAGALRLLEDLGLDPAAVPSWKPVDDVVVRSPSGREATFPLPRDAGLYAAVARRAELDAALLDVARERRRQGARRSRLHGPRRSGTTASCSRSTGSDRSRARYAVAADGMWSPMRKHLGVATPGYLGEWHAFRQYFTDVGPRASQDLFVWFEPDLLPGYAWSFPLPDGRANVGLRHPARRRQGRAGTGDGAAVAGAARAAPHRRGARSRRPAGVAPPGLAHPGPGRRHRAGHPAHALRRRRRRRHRPDDRRGHRPGPPHRDAGGRGDRGRRPRRRARRVDLRAAGARRPRRRPPHVDAARSAPSSTARVPAPRFGSRAPRPGPAATSPAGSSRTIPRRSSPRPAAGSAGRSPVRAPTAPEGAAPPAHLEGMRCAGPPAGDTAGVGDVCNPARQQWSARHG